MIKIYHTPEVFVLIPGIQAGITYSNRKTININGKLTGLNLGDNTGAPKSEIDKNFKRLAEELQWKTEHIALAEQVHGGDVIVVDKPGYYENIDGLVTTEDKLAIAVKVADCAAVLLADPSTGSIAAVHAGWRGAVANILPAAIEKLKSTGADTSRMAAYISPCISLQNFEVGEEVASQFDPTFINRDIGAKPHLDLKSFLNQQLLDAGLNEQKIEIDPRCTIEDTRFYSFRRERENAGRMLAFIRHI
ncbi:peptidoglycan editing factor PgeF [soil metagenome]